jgi:hypothetical protein
MLQTVPIYRHPVKIAEKSCANEAIDEFLRCRITDHAR